MKMAKWLALWADQHQKDWLEYRKLKENEHYLGEANDFRIRLLNDQDAIRRLGFTIKGSVDDGYCIKCKWDEAKEIV